MAYSDLFFISLGSIAFSYGLWRGIKKIRASFKSAAEEMQTLGKNDKTAQSNYWANRLDRVLLPPKKNHSPVSQPQVSDSSVGAPSGP